MQDCGPAPQSTFDGVAIWAAAFQRPLLSGDLPPFSVELPAGVPPLGWPDAPIAGAHPMQGKRAATVVVQVCERWIPLLGSASKIHADPQGPSATSQPQGGT
jgi:hypothetical protein